MSGKHRIIQGSGRRSLRRSLFEGLIAMALMVVVAEFLAGNLRAFKVVSRSMAPTLEIGDRLIAWQPAAVTGRRWTKELKGHVIAFEPTEPGEKSALTKRVLGVGGDTVRIREGRLYVNSKIDKTNNLYIRGVHDQDWSVPESSLFVAGDNRNNSYDSLDYGPIDSDKVLGVAGVRYWPPSRIGVVR